VAFLRGWNYARSHACSRTRARALGSHSAQVGHSLRICAIPSEKCVWTGSLRRRAKLSAAHIFPATHSLNAPPLSPPSQQFFFETFDRKKHRLTCWERIVDLIFIGALCQTNNVAHLFAHWSQQLMISILKQKLTDEHISSVISYTRHHDPMVKFKCATLLKYLQCF
jgi:hypothetical protein